MCFGPKMFTGGMSKVTRQYDGRRRSSRICPVVKCRLGAVHGVTPDVVMQDGTRAKGARPIALRSTGAAGLNAARISAQNSAGCSQAAKWPPLSSLL